MIFLTRYLRFQSSKHFILLLCFVFLISFVHAQKGVINNGAKMIVNSGAFVKISGADGDYTNNTSDGTDGRIDLDGKIEIEGNWINNAVSGGVLINPNVDGEVLFVGSGTQLIGGSRVSFFESLNNGNTAGISLSANIIVYDSLKLDSGLVALNNSDLGLGVIGKISGTFGSDKMIVINGTGRLVKSVGSTGSFTFPVGDTTSVDEYSPVDITLNSHGGLSSAWISVHLSDEKLTENTSPDEYLTRYWTLASDGITSPNYSADFHYLQSDAIGTEEDIYAAEYDGASRSVFSTVNEAGNVLSVAGLSTFANYTGVDGTAPTVVVTTGESDPTNANPITFTVTFSETVTGFDDNVNDIIVGNGTAGTISGSGSVYNFSVIPDGDEKITIDIPSAAALDIAGNENTTSTQFAINYDGTKPTVIISSGLSSPTNTTPIPVTVTFSEFVSDFDIGDIDAVNGAKGTMTTSDSTIFSFNLTPGEGDITLDINADVVTDSAGNYNVAASQFAITYDSTNPIATFSSDESVLTNEGTFIVTIEFNEAVTGFELLDLSDGNCNIGSLTPVKPDTSWTVTVSPIADGAVTVGLVADMAFDLAGNGNDAATQFSIVYDGTSPTVVITSTEVSPTMANPIPVTITFSDVISGFDVSDITESNVTLGSMSTGDSTIFTLNATSTGTAVTLNIGAAVATDAAGNGNDAASQFSITYDGTNPGISLLNPADQATGVSVNTNLEINFDEVVNAGTGFIRLFETGVSEVETFNVESQITGSGSGSIVVDPTITLSSLTAYHIQIDATAFDDVAGNSYAGIADQTTWNFTTADVDMPQISSTSPVDNATGVLIDANLQITFNEDIKANAFGGFIQIYTAADVLFEEFDVSSDVTILNDLVTINPVGEFTGETGYYVLIDDTVFQDLTDNYFNGISNKATWNFVTADVDDPIISSLNPLDDAEDVSVTSDLIINFNEIVNAVSGNIYLYETGVGIVETYNVLSQITGSGTSTITVDPTSSLSGSTDYHIQIDPTAFDDLAGNSFAGISDQITWNYTSADITAPTAVLSYSGTDPTNNSPFVVTITFSEEVQNFVAGDLSVSNGSPSGLNTSDDIIFTVDITPVGQGNVSVILPAGNVQDLAGNGNILSNQITVEFDNVQPTVDITSAQSGTINTDLNITITFSEEVTGFIADSITVTNGSVFSLIEQDPGIEWDAVITPDSDGEVTVDIFAGKAKDAAGNANIAATQFSIIYDGSGPEISGLYPNNGDTDIPVNANLQITFDEVVNINSGFIRIYEFGGATFEDINVSGVSGSGTNTITIDPTSDFGSEVEYYVLIDAGAFVDGVGNEFAGIVSTSYWTFTSSDIVKPTVNSVTPVNGDIDVIVGTNLTITFSEPILANIGNITIKDDDSGLDKEIIDVQGALVTIVSNVVTVDPFFDLDGSTNYHIIVGESSFKDESNNYFGGILLETEWVFVTEDVSVPEVVTLSPEDGISGVSLTANLEITFTEDIEAAVGDIVIMNATGPVEHERIDVQSGQINITGNIATITPSADFDALTDYYVLIDYGAFEDLTGNKYAGITDDTKWNFTTEEDNTNPVVSYYTPGNGATDVVVSTTLQITFSEPVYVNIGNVTIKEKDSGLDKEVIDVQGGLVSIVSNVVTIDPSSDLDEATNYYILVDASSFKDEADNYFEGTLLETDWAFVTEDVSAPEIVTLSPADDASGVSVTTNLEIVFTEFVDAITGDIVIMNASGPVEHERIEVLSGQVSVVDDVVTVIPSADFNELSNYYILIDFGAFEDLAGNKYSGITDESIWNFTTEEDITPPSVEITSTESGTVTGNFDVVITFSETVTGFTSGDVAVSNGSVNTFTETVAGQIWTVTIEPTNDGTVTVDVNAGVAQDIAGNDNIAADQFSIVFDTGGVGVEEIIPYEIMIYSVENNVILEFINESNYQFKEGLLEVYNLLGQKMISENITDFVKFKAKVDNSASQIYIVKVVIDDSSYIKRLFIE
ncbi:MAG: Ig-like domain-containing protein [Bacteroidales bacterium]|nr:Ig-like domain-containing protein [Bacteroidales bacterium]